MNQENHSSNQDASQEPSSKSDAERQSTSKQSKAAQMPNNYSKEHLDAWLETCLLDGEQNQLSSSSEFLDYNPSIDRGSPTKYMNLHNQFRQQQQLQQQHHKQHSISKRRSLMQKNMQQKDFSLGNSRPQLKYPNEFEGYQWFANPMKGNGFDRMDYGNNMPAYMRKIFQQSNSMDFSSLPPHVNLATSFDNASESQDKHAHDDSEMNANSFRFSDPCLINASPQDGNVLPNNENPDASASNKKVYGTIMDQIAILHETNSKILRNLQETKVDVEALKHTPNYNVRHRRDSMSGHSIRSQPLLYGHNGFDGQSSSHTYNSGSYYTPGVMTDVVRELKDAARVREDALINRIKAILEDNNIAANEANMRMVREMDEMKSQLTTLRYEQKDMNNRIKNLEEDNKYLRQMITTIFRSSFQPSQKPTATYSSFDQAFPNLNYTTPGIARQQQLENNLNRVSFGSSDGAADISANIREMTNIPSVGNQHTFKTNSKQKGQINSPPSFALVSPDKDDAEAATQQRICKGMVARSNSAPSPTDGKMSRTTPSKSARHISNELSETTESAVNSTTGATTNIACNIDEGDFNEYSRMPYKNLDSKSVSSRNDRVPRNVQTYSNNEVSCNSHRLSLSGSITDL